VTRKAQVCMQLDVIRSSNGPTLRSRRAGEKEECRGSVYFLSLHLVEVGNKTETTGIFFLKRKKRPRGRSPCTVER